MIKAIIFDVDDTLIQTYRTVFDMYKFLGKKYYGINDIQDADIKKHWGKSWDNVVKGILGNNVNLEIHKQHIQEAKKLFSPQSIPGANKILDELSQNHLLCLLTSTSREIITTDMKNAGLDLSRFSYIHTADDSDFHKPDPRVFEKVVSFLLSKNISKDEIVYIGDGIGDLEASRDAGIKFIAVTQGFTTKKDFLKQKLEEKYIISDIKPIKDLIEKI